MVPLRPATKRVVSRSLVEMLGPQSSESLDIEVKNDIEPGGVPQKGQGIGLKNVKSRLELIYDNPELLAVNMSEAQFLVKLVFPQ